MFVISASLRFLRVKYMLGMWALIWFPVSYSRAHDSGPGRRTVFARPDNEFKEDL
jgi:hypothetical protein